MTTEKSFYTRKSSAGKGDSPRNISKAYWENYDKIEWNRQDDRKEYNFIYPTTPKEFLKKIDKSDNSIILIQKLKPRN